MLNKINTALKILREKGTKEFVISVYEFFMKRLATLYIRKNPERLINKINNFNSTSPEEVFNFSWKLCFGFLRPMQVKEEYVELLKIFKEKKPKYILEIGTANGGSLFCFCKLAPEDATIISIDLPEGKFGGGYPEWKTPIYQSFKKENQKLYLLRKDSHQKETLEEVLKILNGNQLDFLFIDGDHTFEGVKKDFEMYGHLVKKGGIIAFHDIVECYFEPECKVNEFWHKIKQNYSYRELVKDWSQGQCGIGLLYIS